MLGPYSGSGFIGDVNSTFTLDDLDVEHIIAYAPTMPLDNTKFRLLSQSCSHAGDSGAPLALTNIVSTGSVDLTVNFSVCSNATGTDTNMWMADCTVTGPSPSLIATASYTMGLAGNDFFARATVIMATDDEVGWPL